MPTWYRAVCCLAWCGVACRPDVPSAWVSRALVWYLRRCNGSYACVLLAFPLAVYVCMYDCDWTPGDATGRRALSSMLLPCSCQGHHCVHDVVRTRVISTLEELLWKWYGAPRVEEHSTARSSRKEGAERSLATIAVATTRTMPVHHTPKCTTATSTHSVHTAQLSNRKFLKPPHHGQGDQIFC